ncbi:alpha-L-arabinofuranosidase C-terminal domain-containing protein [Enterococcus casseliflavus]|uniref:alpha-L-arabinofuranosidase C-terminal domain-containing protein n=1 Tax=Enterococcus casseliflavus TaxID=37734 RepID=UPI002FBEF0A4
MVTNITLKPNEIGAPLNDLYGVFFEDLNHAADGGIYAEMVQNRSFEFCSLDNKNYHSLTAWEDSLGQPLSEESTRIRVLSDNPIHYRNQHYLKIDTVDELMIKNQGYNQGMVFKEEASYKFSFFARTYFSGQSITVQLKEEGKVLAEKKIDVSGSSWKKYQGILSAKGSTLKGRLALIFPKGSNLAIDMVSLFPKNTYKKWENGCREDICQLLAEMKPKFLRFPGGCLVHDGSLNSEDRDSMYRWKNTVGPVETRGSKRNSWGYNQTCGLGFYEYFLLCEDLGAKPLPVLPGGWDPHHQQAVPLSELDPWVADAIDLVEFAKGGTDTKWGALREEMGHPEPFDLEYLAIGNEEVGQAFFDRYDIIHKALRKKYPEIKIINSAGPFPAGSEWQRGWNNARENKSDLVDEHYYCSPEWFIAHHNQYDNNDPEGPKVFLGEYASKSNTWWSALAEASYMIGLERNADKVGLCCYAPLLCNIDYCNWSPNLIWFNQETVIGSVNYYVQKLFMSKQGTSTIGFTTQNMPEKKIIDAKPITGKLAFKGDGANISLTEIKVKDMETGVTTKLLDRELSEDIFSELLSIESHHYKVSFSFKKTGGKIDKGFKFFFGYTDKDNRYGWSLGGWQNQDCIIDRVIRGTSTDLTQSIWRVEKDTTYNCQIEIRDRKIKTTINGKIFNKLEEIPYVLEAAYINAVIDEKNDKKILKVVNIKEEPFLFTLNEAIGHSAKVIKLLAEKTAENRLYEPNKVEIKEEDIIISEHPLEVPAYGIMFLEIDY